jgi:alcohol dehydrogenase class IV
VGTSAHERLADATGADALRSVLLARSTAAQASVLAGVKDANTDLFTAHLLKEQLRAVFHPPAGVGARSVLAAWLAMVDEAGLPAFDRVADKVRRAPPEIHATSTTT